MPPTRGLLVQAFTHIWASPRPRFVSVQVSAIVLLSFWPQYAGAGNDVSGSAVISINDDEIYKCVSPPGQHANCKHLGGGNANFTLVACEAEMRTLEGDTINFRDSGACWVKKCSSKDLEYSSKFGGWEVYSIFCKPCRRPTGWCNLDHGAVYRTDQDCDGDGIADPSCDLDTLKRHGYIGSSSGCADTWPKKQCGGGFGLFGGLKNELENMGGFGKILKKAESEEHKIANKLAPAEKALDEVYKGMNQPDYNAPPHLGGNDLVTVNVVVCVIVGFLIITTGVAAYIDYFHPLQCLEGRPKLWAIAMLLTSYLLLIPGLTNVLLSFSIVVNVIGHRIRVHPRAEHPSCTESTPGLIELLYDTGGQTGAMLIIVFAMVIPAMELVMLTFGEIFRFCGNGRFTRAFRVSIIWVQHRSKWASPDMFAYTLLVYLIRHLDHDPLILTKAQLDIGFCCFCAFCVCATVSSLGFPLPDLRGDEGFADPAPPLVVRCFGRRSIALVATVLGAFSATLLFFGSTQAVMAFRINERPLYQPVGPLPQSAKAAVDVLDIPNMLDADVSLLECIKEMSGWAAGGEATSAVASVMWGIFVLGLTFANILMLVLSAWRYSICGTEAGHEDWFLRDPVPMNTSPSACPFMSVSRVLKKLAMLDVAVVGIYLVTYCMAIYKKIGVLVSTRQGIVLLLAAEVVHVLLYWVVSSAVGFSDHAQPYLAADLEDEEFRKTGTCPWTHCFFKIGRRAAGALPAKVGSSRLMK